MGGKAQVPVRLLFSLGTAGARWPDPTAEAGGGGPGWAAVLGLSSASSSPLALRACDGQIRQRRWRPRRVVVARAGQRRSDGGEHVLTQRGGSVLHEQ